MSLITRCPACRTMFKVVPDQLRISEGWVRCGQCDEIFDASANMQDPLAVEALPSEPVDIELEMTATPAEGVAAPDAASDRSPPMEAEPFPVEPEPGAVPASESVWHSEGPETAVLTDVWDSTPRSETTDSTEPVAPSFMRKTRDRTKTGVRPRRRVLWLVAATVLSLTLFVQLFAHERDKIAVVAPGFKPVVEAVCVLMQCSVAPWRQIESVLIDSSSFSKLRADVYRLSLTFKNTAERDVALPALELSVTDTQDQVLIRRVFLAGDLGLPSTVLAAGSEFPVSLALNIATNGNAERITGYRVLAFYP